MLWPVLAVAVIGLSSCDGEKTPLEQQIRELNEKAAAAVMAKDVSALKDMVSEDYRDQRGGDRRSVVRLVQLYLFRHKSIHLYMLTKSLQVLGENEAVAEVFVAAAGEAIEEPDRLFDVKADLLRFSVRYVQEGGEWRVIDADWRQARVDDFL